jgi:hypothetical protein
LLSQIDAVGTEDEIFKQVRAVFSAYEVFTKPVLNKSIILEILLVLCIAALLVFLL